MSYKVESVATFRKEVKKLIKKYPSLKIELAGLGEKLTKNPNTGTPLGNNCYKIRMAVASKGKGKSGGTRVITHFHIAADTVFLLSIYDKSDQENISDKQVINLIKQIR